ILVAKSNKKKQPEKKPKAKGVAVLSEVALTKAEQLPKEARKTFTYHMQVAQVMDSTLSRSDEEDDDENDLEETDINDDDSDDIDESDDERMESDSDVIPDPNKTYKEYDDDEEEYDDKFHLEEDENIDEEEDDESGFEQEEEDAHVTLTPVLDTQKTGGLTQSSSVSSDFTSKLLNLDNPSSTDNEIASLMDTTAYHATTIPKIISTINKAIQAYNFDCREEAQAKKKEYIEVVNSMLRTIINKEVNAQLPQIHPQMISDVATLVIKKNVTKLLETVVLTWSSSQPQSSKDQDSSAGSDRGTKTRKSSKDAESSRDSRSKEKKSSSTSKDASQTRHKSSGKSAHAEETSQNVEDSSKQQDQEFINGDNDEQLADNEVTKADWLKIMKKYDYGHLEEIEVRRDDQQLYTFKEGDFKILRLQDIEDMLLLLVQQRLTNLTIDERNKTAYTSYSDPHEIIYVDQNRRKRLMRTDKLHKFSDGTLNDVWSALHDIAAVIRMEYLRMRTWSYLDKKGDRFNTTAGNPVKEILLKLNLPDHMSILTDSKVTPTKHRQMRKPYSSSRFIANCFISGIHKDRHEELQEKCVIKAFKLSYQEKYEHVGPEVTRSQESKRSQASKRSQDDDKRLCLVDDLKEFKITFISSKILKSIITTSIHKSKIKVKDYELKTKVKA
nr:hypothetical protein [Tanacetum cinerariifolium]